MAEVLQSAAPFHAFLLVSLLRNLIAYAPHDDGRMVAMMEQEVGDILLSPFIEEACVAVLALRILPHVKAFRHHHHAHGVADLHLHLGRHIVCGADSVASHVLHQPYLAYERGFVDSGAERSEVMVQANALQLAAYAIELEASVLADFHGTDAERSDYLVNKLVVAVQSGTYLVKIRSLR